MTPRDLSLVEAAVESGLEGWYGLTWPPAFRTRVLTGFQRTIEAFDQVAGGRDWSSEPADFFHVLEQERDR